MIKGNILYLKKKYNNDNNKEINIYMDKNNSNSNSNDKFDILTEKELERFKTLTNSEILKELAGGDNSIYKKATIIVIIFVLSLSLTGLISSYNKRQIANETPVANELRDTVFREKEKNDRYTEKLKEKEQTLTRLREDVTKNNKLSDEQRKKIDNNNTILGLTKVTGKGVQIVLKDGEENKKAGSTLEASQTIVHDVDILEIINVLRNAGAEAISINGHRIIATSPISCIGTVIKINDEKVGAPYVISAIGNPEALESALNIPGGIISILEKFGIKITKEKKEEIKIPEYTGVYKYQYLKAVGEKVNE